MEVAVVQLAAEGHPVVGSWSSLVNPERHPGPTHAHGLTTDDLALAPTFWDIAPEIAELLDGCVIAAHNVNFDAAFLRYEFWRLGRSFPDYPLLDTVRVGYKLGRIAQGGSRKLRDLCAHECITPHDAHQALGDALAAGELLDAYLRMAQRRGLDFGDLAVSSCELPARAGPFPPRLATKAVHRK